MIKCACGCGQEIEIKPHHKYRGVPKYIRGHQLNVCNPVHISGPWNKGVPWSLEMKDKISKSIKKNYKKENHPNYGKHHSEETKKRMSDVKLGEKNPCFGKLPWNKGIPHKKETKEKMSNKEKGENSPNWKGGKPHCGVCGKQLSHYKSKFCMEHYDKVGENNPHWDGGMPNCKVCGKELGNREAEYCSRCVGIRFKGEKNPFYGKQHTKETKKKISDKITTKLSYLKNPKWKGAYYNSPCQGRIWLKSSYEVAYAKWLDSQKILWFYEIETFDLDDTTYTPDFFLPITEKFIEIKGWMKPDSEKKINLFKEQYHWDIDVLFKKDLLKLGVSDVK